MISKSKHLLAGAVAAATTAALVAGVGPGSLPSAEAAGSVKVLRTLLKGQNVPWGLAELSSSKILYTERDSHLIRWVNLKTGKFHTLGRISAARSDPSAGGEGGLLGIAVDPHFSKTHVLYIYYSTSKDNRVARVHYYPGRAAYHQLGRPHVIKAGIPHGLHHNGGQLSIGPDSRLYVSTGDAQNTSLPQNKKSLGGKILRMTLWGKPAPGNPIKGSTVWSYGHRNVQGLAWDTAGRLWASEFGDRKADELNLIKKGHNYGWPATQGRTSHKGYTSPVAQWGTEVDSPSGIAYTESAIWMGALKGERLWRIPMNGTKAGKPTAFLVGRYGRIRSVLRLSTGRLLITTSNTDGRATPGSSDDRLIEVSVR